MRKLSDSYLHDLKEGYLSALIHKVQDDIDLDLFIRDNYINIYFKGNSLLKLTERKRSGTYAVDIHPKYLQDLEIEKFIDEESVMDFVTKIPLLKENILHFGKPSLEIEYEQLIVRANNNEKRNNSDYFMIDRQYTLGDNYRIDLMGIYWPNPRRRNQIAFPCLLEIKFALNNDIKNVHRQLEGYYRLISENPSIVSEDLRSILQQRLDLGLFKQDKNRLEALRTLDISPRLEDFKFVLALVDYNPHSTLLDLSHIRDLPFSNQINVLYGGFGMWEENLDSSF